MKLKSYHISAAITLAIALFVFPIAKFRGSQAINIHSDGKTCFYELHVPADIDRKSTQFDTVIVRSETCQKHVIRLESWGTETSYQIQPPDSSKSKEFKKYSSHFHHDNPGSIDITDLPAGIYSVQLLACQNGGMFTLRVK
jgi:hypothetical protein